MATCPICETERPAAPYKPFCSRRCADIDLSRWLKGSYAIPGDPVEDIEAAQSDPSTTNRQTFE